MKVIYLLILVFLPFANSFSQRVPTGLYDVQENSPHMPIRFKINNTGQIGQCGDSLSSGITYNGVEYIRNLGLSIFTGNRQDNFWVLHAYTPISKKSFFTPISSGDADDLVQYAKVYFSTDFDANGAPEDFAGYNYPLWKSIVDSSQEASQFITNPAKRNKQGSLIAPDYTSQEDIVVSYSDLDVKNYQVDSLFRFPYKPDDVKPYGINVTQKVMSFSSGPFQNCLLIRYYINNRTNLPISIYPHLLTEFAINSQLFSNNGREFVDTFAIDDNLVRMDRSIVWNSKSPNNLGYVMAGVLSSSVSKAEGLSDTSLLEQKYYSSMMPFVANTQLFNEAEFGYIFFSEGYKEISANAMRTLFIADSLPQKRLFQFCSPDEMKIGARETSHVTFGIVIGEKGISEIPTGTIDDIKPVRQKFNDLTKLNNSIVSRNIVLDVQDRGDVQPKTASIRVTPNPNAGTFAIKGLDSNKPMQVSIYSSLGELLESRTGQFSDEQLWDCNRLSTGLYSVVVKSNRSVYSSLFQIVK